MLGTQRQFTARVDVRNGVASVALGGELTEREFLLDDEDAVVMRNLFVGSQA